MRECICSPYNGSDIAPRGRDCFMFTMVCAVILDCPRSNPSDPCRIPLPLQNPTEKCGDQHGPPMGAWPAMFLCLKHAHVCVRSQHNVQLEHEMRVQGQPIPSLWRIECECGHENCGGRLAIYTARAPDWETIEKVILIRNPAVSCEGHPFVWRKGQMNWIEIAHDSLMR
jgi:hypothetical protein